MLFLKIVLVICILCVSTLHAQEENSLRINLVDLNSSLIQKASIRLKNRQGEIIKQITESENSTFVFSTIEEGNYLLEINSPGFKEFIQNIKISKGKNTVVIKLEIEEIKASVDVVRNERQRRLDEVFNTSLTQDQINSLPDNPGEIAEELRRRYGDDVVIRVDGFTGGQIPPKEQIASIRVTRSSFDAEFHEIGQTIIDIKTKAGGKVFFGFVNFFYNNSFLNSRNAFAKTKLPSQNINTFGFLIFPSINKEKTSLSIQFRNFSSFSVNNIIAVRPDSRLNSNTKSGFSNFSPTSIVTHNLSKNHTLNARYIFEKNTFDNLGIGGFNLPDRAYSSRTTAHIVRLFESGTIGKTASQFRFEYSNSNSQNLSKNDIPTVNVIGAFNAGGAGISNRNRQRKLLLSEIIYFDYGKNSFKFGGEAEYENRHLESADNLNGVFVFSNLTDYLNNKPYSFTQRQKVTNTNISQLQTAFFIQNDIRLYKNFQVGFGLRYEYQNNLKDYNNLSPRLSFSWSPDKDTKLVVRSGAGIFYQWLGTTSLSTILSNDGRRGNDLIIINPNYPNPVVNRIVSNILPPSIMKKSDDLINPYVFITKTGFNYRFNKKLDLESFYIFRRGLHQFRNRDINAPINGQRPTASYGRITQIESSGNLVENSLELKLEATLRKGFSFDTNYKLGKIMSDYEDIFSLPENNYNTRLEWAVSNLDQRHRFSSRLSFPSWKNLSFSTIFRLESPRPYTITTGRDDNNDSVINDRPFGILRNSRRGDWFKQADATFNWKTKLSKEDLKNPLSKLKNQLIFTATVQNLFNQTNKQNFIGIQTSPFFQQATTSAPARTIQFGLSYLF